MQTIILPKNIEIDRHASKRFLERIIIKENYTDNDIKIAKAIIKNVLTQRILKYKTIDENTLQIKYCNALFVYRLDLKVIITVYENNYNKSRDKIEWVYKLPNIIQFKSGINSKSKLELLTKGLIPIYKEGVLLIGECGSNLYCFNSYFNVISLYDKCKFTNPNI